MRIVHIADEHWDQDKLPKCQPSAEFIEQVCVKLKPDIIFIAGDLQNRRQYLSGSSAVLPMINHVIALANIAPLVIIYGNAEHDSPGSLDFIPSLETENPIHVSSRAETVLFTDGKFLPFEWDHVDQRIVDIRTASCMLHLFPYPTKQWFLAGKENLSIDESNQLIQNELRKIFQGFGVLSMEATCPVFLVGHCNVYCAKLSSGQTLLGQDILVSKHDLELARADYYALGHIHKAQDVGPNMYYSGSTYHCNSGETEKKQFNVVDIDKHGQEFFTVDEVEIPSVPLSLHEAEWDTKSGWSDEQPEKDWAGAELRIRVHVTKECGDMLTDEQIQNNYPGAHSYQIERIIIPEERVRAAQIVKAKTLPEKVQEWGNVIDKEIPPEVLEMAGEVERSAV